MGYFKTRAPLLSPGYRNTVIGSASSAGAYVGPTGAWQLYADTSAGGAAPKVVYLKPGKVGDRLEIYANFGGCSSNGIAMRTPTSGSSGQYFAGSTALDNILFMTQGYGATLVQGTSLNWMVQGLTTAGPSTIWPGGVMGASTS